MDFPTEQEFNSLLLHRFLNEPRHLKTIGSRNAFLDVAIGRTGEAWLNTKGHQSPRLRRTNRCAHHGDKGISVGDVVICRTEQQQRIRGGRQCGQGHGSRRVLCLRLEDLAHRETSLRSNVGHQKAVFLGRHTGDGFRSPLCQRRHTLQRQLQQGLVAQQRNELLGKRLARQRPKPCTATTAKDDRLDHGYGAHG